MEPSQCAVLLAAQVSCTPASGSLTENFCCLLPSKKGLYAEVQTSIAFISMDKN